MSIAYLALVCGFEDVAGSDDATDAAWFDMIVNESEIRIFSASAVWKSSMESSVESSRTEYVYNPQQ